MALECAQKYNGELLSADSRQIYRGMDIGTGKDISHNFKLQISNVKWERENISYFTDGLIKIWGLDIVNPDEEFSVSHFREFSKIVIEDIWSRKKLPIIVGGTGLYIRSLLEPLSDIPIPKNESLRNSLEHFDAVSLQKKLVEIDEKRFLAMNESDRKNPRRLVRAIEIAQFLKSEKPMSVIDKKNEKINVKDVLYVGLTASKEILFSRIKARVQERIANGMFFEVEKLLEKGYSPTLPSMSATGYRLLMSNDKLQILNRSQISQEVINQWVQEEFQYAKRQLTWFKKQKNTHWFDVGTEEWKLPMVDLLEEWYNRNES